MLPSRRSSRPASRSSPRCPVSTASRLTPNPDLLSYKDVKDADGFVPAFKAEARAVFALYQLKVVTSPNDAIYEVSFFYYSHK